MRCGRISLADDWNDVLRKAMQGQGVSTSALSERAGLSMKEAEGLLAGKYDEACASAAATVLGLHAPSLQALAHGKFTPDPICLPEGMTMFTSEWEEMSVHSYLAWDTATGEAAAFDTGADASDMLGFLRAHGLTLRLLLLTHGHGDHVFETDRVVARTGAEVRIGEGEGVAGIATFAAGKGFHVGKISVSTRLTNGHTPGGITYVIDGLELPVAVVGDALFARSMGAPNISYTDCLRGNLKEILTLSPETILCPGHGPLTTVAQELAHNPFFAQG